jgi:guanylate kinase
MKGFTTVNPFPICEVQTVPREDWDELPGRLIVVSGPSGAGKSTLARRLVGRPEVRARLSVSTTTRPPRPGERDGVDYHFTTREAFEAARAGGAFLEWAEVHGNLYGTPIGPLRDLLGRGLCVILVIDVQGGVQVLRRVPNALSIFIRAPSLDVLEARLRSRGTDDDAAIRRRLDNARREIEAGATSYRINVLNEDLEEAVDSLAANLIREGCGGR